MRAYTVAARNQSMATASGDYDLMSLAAAAEKPIKIRSLIISNISEVGDAQEEQLDVSIVRGNTTAASGGASATPRALDAQNTVAAGFTARVADTTPASSGTLHELYHYGINVRAGAEYIFTDTMQPSTANGLGLLCVRLNTAVADAVTFSITAVVEEGV